jgi:hypothetical protein
MLFEVMRGKKSIGEAKCVPSQFLCSDKECSEWAGASSWVDWWLTLYTPSPFAWADDEILDFYQLYCVKATMNCWTSITSTGLKLSLLIPMNRPYNLA